MANNGCRICGRFFMPDRRTGARQKVCGRAGCQLERKRMKLRSWRARHVGHVAVHQGKQKAWAKAFPHYWRWYRRGHADYRRRDNLRRARALRRRRRSANETHWRVTAVEKLRAIVALRGAECSANETQIVRRVAAIEDCLLSTGMGACSAKEVDMDWGARPGDNAAP